MKLKRIEVRVKLGVRIKEGIEEIKRLIKNMECVLNVKELAYKKELKVRLREVEEISITEEGGLIVYKGSNVEEIGRQNLGSAALLQPNIEGKLYINKEYMDKVIESVAIFDITEGVLTNYAISLTIDKITNNLYE